MAPARRPDADALQAWRGLLRYHTTVIELLDRELRARHDLPLAWYDVLVQLSEAGGERTMGDLAGALLVSPSNCTRLVARLVDAGLVSRRADEHDARIRHAAITPQGRAILRRAAPTHLAGIRRWFADAAVPGDLATLAAFFDRAGRRLVS